MSCPFFLTDSFKYYYHFFFYLSFYSKFEVGQLNPDNYLFISTYCLPWNECTSLKSLLFSWLASSLCRVWRTNKKSKHSTINFLPTYRLTSLFTIVRQTINHELSFNFYMDVIYYNLASFDCEGIPFNGKIDVLLQTGNVGLIRKTFF